MRCLVIVKASKESESGQMPSREMLTAMGTYNEGARVRFGGKQPTVVDGPFAETKELVAGYWLWKVKSLDEAIEWLKRAPFETGDEVEIRPLFELDDFGDEMTPELRAQEERLLKEGARLAREGR